MEQRENTTGRALLQSLKNKYRQLIPSRPLRVAAAFGAILLILGLLVGVVCGCIAIGKCHASPAASQGADPVVSLPTLPNNESVVRTETTPVPETDAPVPDTPAPVETPAPETPDPGPETDYLGGRTFHKGDYDELILTVQSTLMDLGYMDSDEPTDFFGNQTHDALVCFQRHNDIVPDGILGEQTYALLVSGQAKEYVMQEGDEGDDVKEVQERLFELGYLDKGSRTGTFGEKTAAAVRDFQSANKLKVDGKVGAKTLNALYSSDVVGNSYKYGDSDPSIVAFQKQLVKLGYLDKDYDCTGKMDKSTVAAIKSFQEANGLVRDGCLGPATMEMLNSKNAVKYAIRLGMSGSAIKAAQQRLYDLGYIRSHSVTGYFGESTEEAVKAFQKRNGLTQTGELNEKTLEKLNSKKAKAAPKQNNGGSSGGSGGSGGSSGGSGGSSGGSGGSGGSSGGSNEQAKRGVEKFITVAKSRLGCKYVRGSKGPDQFDCSGFVYWCLNQAGVKQGYMTSIVWRTCSKYKRITSMKDLKRGDVLVFSGKTANSGHVGIYLGDDAMIDASSAEGKIRITYNISKSKYWTSHFLMAYRIWD
ncbi:MAG: peptidoglycan-binding protein [Clostridia bacterium]|nr:peptidoglycan-binding protein [Clostridia bacterium]